jgi:hypothetical protein
MATTTNYGWTTPDDTALVKDGASAIRTLGSSIDTSLNNALGTKKAGLVLLNTTSFSAVSSVSLPANSFSATYRNYKININWTVSNESYLQGRLRASGSDNSTSNYGSAFMYQSLTGGSPSGDTNASATQTSWTKMAYGLASNDNSATFDIYQPQISGKTFGIGNQMRSDANFIYVGLLQQGTTSFDSLTFIAGVGTISGSVNVYGYNI